MKTTGGLIVRHNSAMMSKEKVEAMNRIGKYAVGLMLSLGLVGIPAGAQNQAPSNTQSASSGQSLGDYARQIRKNPDAGSKPKVFDNDNLPKNDKLSVVGNAGAAAETKTGEEAKAENETKPAAESAPKSASAAAEEEANKQAAVKQWTDKIDAQKQQVDLLTRELDVLQREYQLRAAAMYADAGNRLRNSTDWDKQDAQYKQQIADKQKALEEAKQKLDDVQEEARKAGMPESVQQQAQQQ